MNQIKSKINADSGIDLLNKQGRNHFSTILADPPWQFQNRTGKMRLSINV